MRLEGPQNLESRREDSDCAIMASKKQVLGTRTAAAYFVIFEEGSGLVIWSFNLTDFKEIKRLPLMYS